MTGSFFEREREEEELKTNNKIIKHKVYRSLMLTILKNSKEKANGRLVI